MAEENKRLTCIGCPLGCRLYVALRGGQVAGVTGHTCPRGEAYARKEVTAPTRSVTTTVRVWGSRTGAVTVPCKTSAEVPKAQVQAVVASLKGVAVPAPVRLGQVLLTNVAGTGTDLVATAGVE